MTNSHQTQIIRSGNSKGVRITKEPLPAFETKKVVIKLINNSLVISPLMNSIPPRNKWAAILATMTITKEDDFNDFDTTLSDYID